MIAEYLATFVDEGMKSGFRGLSETEVDECLNKVVQLFRFLSSKDAFEEYYKTATAKRLLSGRVANEDYERTMIGKLRAECGANFTTKLEGMFSDFDKSKLEMSLFRSERGKGSLSIANNNTMELDVTILTAPNWSSVVKPSPSISIPSHLSIAIDEFTKFYLEKHSGRKLSWTYGKGTADIRATFGKGSVSTNQTSDEGAAAIVTGMTEQPRTYEINVSTHQMILLLAFNNANLISFRELASLGIPDDELKRNLLSLTNPKNRILNKSTDRKEIVDDDVFSVNDGFTSKLLRFQVRLVSMKSALALAANVTASHGRSNNNSNLTSINEDADVVANIEEGRKAMLESVIVRIMKTRKHMEHNALVAEVARMVSTRFIPDVGSIKKRIEHLIDRDYLERAAENANLYTYLA
jgi:cullin 3